MTEAVRIHDLAEPELPEWFLELHDTMGIGPDQPLDPAELPAEAVRREGLDDFGDPWFVEPFETAGRVGRGRRPAQPDGPLPDP